MPNQLCGTVKVCNGPGCKAWSSQELINELSRVEGKFGSNAKLVKPVSCMNKCGGGISVKSKACKSVLKFRKLISALSVLVPESLIQDEKVCS